MKIEVYASVGFMGGEKTRVIEIDPLDIEDMSRVEREMYFYELADDFGHEVVETGFEIIED